MHGSPRPLWASAFLAVFVGLLLPLELAARQLEPADESDAAIKRPRFLLGARLAFVAPNSTASMTGAAMLEFQWRSDLHDRRLGVSMDMGWYHLFGEGSQVEPGMGAYEYSYKTHGLPVHLGLLYEPPLEGMSGFFLDGPWPFLEGGLALIPVVSFGTLSNEDGHVFLETSSQRDLAVGLYIGAGCAFSAGPGEALLSYRFTTAYTDMGYSALNHETADIYGSQVYLGYRLTF